MESSLLQKEINSLTDEDPKLRKKALLKLYAAIVIPETPLPPQMAQALLPKLQKPLLKRLADSSEKCRELALNILKMQVPLRARLIEGAEDMSISLPYMLPVMAERLNAGNLEGYEHLQEKQRPTPTQKPQVMSALIETSEEIRLQLAQLMTVIVAGSLPESLAPFLDDLVGSLRALAMDPFGEVIQEGCRAIGLLCEKATPLLLHFSTNLGRACLTALVHKHAKVRLAGLLALCKSLYCGAYKYSYEVLEALIGFRDPNVVPIKDFYEPSTKINYFARLIADGSPNVRQHFYRVIGEWLTRLPDKQDHQGRLVPYLLTGLFDESTQIQSLVAGIIEEMGAQYQQENEEKLRETKQFAIDSAWTRDSHPYCLSLAMPAPLKRRPRLGARCLIRNYTRRYLKGIYNELMDWIHENRLRSAHLLLYAIIYSEDYLTQFLDNFLLALYRALLSDDQADPKSRKLRLRVEECTHYLGRFCAPKSYSVFVLPALRNKLAQSLPYAQLGALRAAGFLLKGSIQAIPLEVEDLSSIDQFMAQFLSIFEDPLFQLDSTLAMHLIECLHNILTMIQKRYMSVPDSLYSEKWLLPTISIENRICKLLLKAISELEIGQLYGTGFKAQELLKSSQTQTQECFSIMDMLRADNSYYCRELVSNQLLRETILKSEDKNADWSLHSQGFKYLASYILRFEQTKEEESKETKLEWSELVAALSRVIEGTTSFQMAKSCFKLIEILLKKNQQSWAGNQIISKCIQVIFKEMVYFSGKEDKKKEKDHLSLFEMARPLLLKLLETGLLFLGRATHQSGLLDGIQQRLAKTKLKDRKNILEVLKALADSKIEQLYLQEIWSGEYKTDQNPWVVVTQILLQGYQSTDPAVQYENAKTLQAVVKTLVSNDILPLKEPSSIIPKWVMDILRSPLQVPFFINSIPQDSMDAIKSEASSELKAIETLFSKPKEAVSSLLAHAVDDTGSTRVEVIKTLVTLKKFAIPGVLMKEMISARQKQSYKRCEVLLMLFL